MPIRAVSKAGSEPIPGYILRKRLGAGGYGEVWLADAPGGLQKAVKLIYGSVDESQAASELRSLQRVRQVYHPFLLSIERIEIIEHQVVIVTELAESSLLDRFEQCRRRGSQGIDRSPLLDFMKDAADALDFLSLKHGLQHLDVKPGNLLIIADRIKVGDFGLIKDLHDNNQSLVSGLTPTYSAPEIFDGRPDYRSDQYSLAIVYMEMLTGQVPFSGKTTGELARQHLTQAPDLASLPPADMPIVGRALSKNPLDRYATCRMFIEQLMKTRGAVLPAQKFAPSAQVSDTSVDLSLPDGRKTSKAASLDESQVMQPALNTKELASQWSNSRGMFIGLGGIGCRTLLELRQLASQDCDNRFDIDDHGWAAIDTDARLLSKITDQELSCSLKNGDTFELRIFSPSVYRDVAPELFTPLSRRWLYNIPRSLKTEGVRPLAILSFLHHYDALRNRIRAQLNELVKKHTADNDSVEPLKIYLIASSHGGTGGALLAEMGFLIRRIMSELGFGDYRICALTSAATTTHNSKANLHSAAGIATLSELSYLMEGDHEVNSIHYADTPLNVVNAKPFDWVSLIDGGMYGLAVDCEKTVRGLASAAWLDSQSMLGAALTDSRIDARKHQHGWLHACNSAHLAVSCNVNASTLARWCCEQTLNQLLKVMVGPRGISTGSSLAFSELSSSQGSSSGDFPLTPQASNDFTKRMLFDMGIGDPTVLLNDATRQGFSAMWSRRLSSSTEIGDAQLAQDMTIWKGLISRIVKTKLYNWKQIEQIQLNAIEAIIGYYENSANELADQLRLAMTEQPCAVSADAVVGYLKLLSESCMNHLQAFQQDGKQLSKRVASWAESLSSEKSLNEEGGEVCQFGLTPNLQILAGRVNAALESSLFGMITDNLGLEPAKHRPPSHEEDSGEAAFDLTYLLSLAGELVDRVAIELGITEDEFTKPMLGAEPSLNAKDIADFTSLVSQCGSKVHRLVVVPAEQESIVLRMLDEEKLTSTTTVIRSRRSQPAQLLTETQDVRLYQLCSNLWRPCAQTMQLAERLRTRTDIEWEPATKLLQDFSISSDPALGLPQLCPTTAYPPAQVKP